MANEITITAKIKCTNGELVVPESGVVRLSIDQATQGYAADVVATTDTWTLLASSPPSPGWGYYKNLDSTNTISLGPENNKYTVELKPGEVALFRSSQALGADASTGTPKLQYIIFED